MSVRVANLVLGPVVTLIGAVALVDASELDMFGELGVPGPGFLPNLVAGMLVGLGLLLTAVTLLRPRVPAARAEWADGGPVDGGLADEEPGFELSGLLRTGRVWLGLLVSIPLMTFIGFVPAMTALMAYLVFAVERMTGAKAVLATVLVPAVVYVIFTFLLGVDLPASTLFGQT